MRDADTRETCAGRGYFLGMASEPHDLDLELELLTLAQVSRLTKLSRDTLKRDIAADRLHIIRLGERSVRVRRTELQRYLEAGEA